MIYGTNSFPVREKVLKKTNLAFLQRVMCFSHLSISYTRAHECTTLHKLKKILASSINLMDGVGPWDLRYVARNSATCTLTELLSFGLNYF